MCYFNIKGDDILKSSLKSKKQLPLPQRYVDRQDRATLKTIEIIGRKKYKKLLDEGIIMVDYEIKKENDVRHKAHTVDLEATVRVLSKMTSPSGLSL